MNSTKKNQDDLDTAILGIDRVLAEFRAAQEDGYPHDVGHMALHMTFFLQNSRKRLRRIRDDRRKTNV